MTLLSKVCIKVLMKAVKAWLTISLFVGSFFLSLSLNARQFISFRKCFAVFDNANNAIVHQLSCFSKSLMRLNQFKLKNSFEHPANEVSVAMPRKLFCWSYGLLKWTNFINRTFLRRFISCSGNLHLCRCLAFFSSFIKLSIVGRHFKGSYEKYVESKYLQNQSDPSGRLRHLMFINWVRKWWKTLVKDICNVFYPFKILFKDMKIVMSCRLFPFIFPHSINVADSIAQFQLLRIGRMLNCCYETLFSIGHTSTFY